MLRGALAAALTPLRDDGAALDEDAFRPYLDFLAGGGLDGILALGTTGEGILLSAVERRRAAELFLAGPVTVIERLQSDVSNLAGLKVSDRPLEAVEPYLVEGLDVFVGAEDLLPVQGAAGTVSGLASVFPERVVALDGVGELRAALDRYP